MEGIDSQDIHLSLPSLLGEPYGARDGDHGATADGRFRSPCSILGPAWQIMFVNGEVGKLRLKKLVARKTGTRYQ